MTIYNLCCFDELFISNNCNDKIFLCLINIWNNAVVDRQFSL